jgi:beta-phosphoglucomutase
MKGIIFDLDGVLCFTDKFHYQAWKTLADELALPFDESINNQLRGVSRRRSLDIILSSSHKKYSEEEKKAFANQKNSVYRQLLTTLNSDDMAANALEILTYLRHNGIKIAIGSSSKNTKFILEQLGLTPYMDAIVDGNDIEKSKPDPEVFLKAAMAIGKEPQACIVIEDAQAGIDAANAGGFISVSIGDAIDLSTSDYHIDSLLDLKKMLSLLQD